jgi:hypothetical protein
MPAHVQEELNTVHPQETQLSSCNVTDEHKSDKRVIISASNCNEDKLLAEKIQGTLHKRGLAVCFQDQLNKATGEAIINALALIIVLSEDTVHSPVCSDHVALAYVSNKPIIPVCEREYNSVMGTLDFGMKLTVKDMKWIMFSDEDNHAQAFIELSHRLDELLMSNNEGQNPTIAISESQSGSSVNIFKPIRKQELPLLTSTRSSTLTSTPSNEVKVCDPDKLLVDSGKNFWEIHFGLCESTSWAEFEAKFLNEYRAKIELAFGHNQTDWMMERLHFDIFKKAEIIYREDFLIFQGYPNKKHQFWHRVKEYMLESHMIREVFNMESTVRLAAVQNLSKFGSATVVAALLQLLQDQDANIRAVAALSLSHCGHQSAQIERALIRGLGDEDRIVRESCCISLGNIGCTTAIHKLANLWYM